MSERHLVDIQIPANVLCLTWFMPNGIGGACYCPISWFYQLKCNGYFQIHKIKTGFGEDIKVLYVAVRLQLGFVDKVV